MVLLVQQSVGRLRVVQPSVPLLRGARHGAAVGDGRLVAVLRTQSGLQGVDHSL